MIHYFLSPQAAGRDWSSQKPKIKLIKGSEPHGHANLIKKKQNYTFAPIHWKSVASPFLIFVSFNKLLNTMKY